MIVNLLLLISSGLCLLYSIIKYLGKKTAIFSILIAGAIGCFMLGHLYEFITDLITGEIPPVFNVGMLARIGGFAFLFSASFAQMDGLVDDRSREMLKFRISGAAAPLLVFILFLPVVFSSIGTAEKLTAAAMTAFCALASYFNFKHLIIPDVSSGIIASIRFYNLFALVSELAFVLKLSFEKIRLEPAAIVCSILLALSYPCMLIAMEKGRQRWIA